MYAAVDVREVADDVSHSDRRTSYLHEGMPEELLQAKLDRLGWLDHSDDAIAGDGYPIPAYMPDGEDNRNVGMDAADALDEWFAVEQQLPQQGRDTEPLVGMLRRCSIEADAVLDVPKAHLKQPGAISVVVAHDSQSIAGRL